MNPLRITAPAGALLLRMLRRRYGYVGGGAIFTAGQGITWTAQAYSAADALDRADFDPRPFPLGDLVYPGSGLLTSTAIALAVEAYQALDSLGKAAAQPSSPVAALLRLVERYNQPITIIAGDAMIPGLAGPRSARTTRLLMIGGGSGQDLASLVPRYIPPTTPTLTGPLRLEAERLALNPRRTTAESQRLSEILSPFLLGNSGGAGPTAELLAERAAIAAGPTAEEIRRAALTSINSFPPETPRLVRFHVPEVDWIEPVREVRNQLVELAQAQARTGETVAQVLDRLGADAVATELRIAAVRRGPFATLTEEALVRQASLRMRNPDRLWYQAIADYLVGGGGSAEAEPLGPSIAAGLRERRLPLVAAEVEARIAAGTLSSPTFATYAPLDHLSAYLRGAAPEFYPFTFEARFVPTAPDIRLTGAAAAQRSWSRPVPPYVAPLPGPTGAELVQAARDVQLMMDIQAAADLGPNIIPEVATALPVSPANLGERAVMVARQEAEVLAVGEYLAGVRHASAMGVAPPEATPFVRRVIRNALLRAGRDARSAREVASSGTHRVLRELAAALGEETVLATGQIIRRVPVRAGLGAAAAAGGRILRFAGSVPVMVASEVLLDPPALGDAEIRRPITDFDRASARARALAAELAAFEDSLRNPTLPVELRDLLRVVNPFYTLQVFDDLSELVRLREALDEQLLHVARLRRAQDAVNQLTARNKAALAEATLADLPSLAAPSVVDVLDEILLEEEIRRLLAARNEMPWLRTLAWPELPAASSMFPPVLPFSPEEPQMPTIFKGTVDFNTPGWGGWSESVYSDVTSDTQQTMMQKMIRWLTLRMKLSNGQDIPGCSNPVVPFAVRVEDELVLRDAYALYCLPAAQAALQGGIAIPQSFAFPAFVASVNNQNLDVQLGPRVKFQSGGGGQIANPMFHGMPIGGLAGGITAPPSIQFLRQASPTGAWLQNLANLARQMAQDGLGYRNITGAWNGANNVPGLSSAPADWYYNASLQMIELQFTKLQFPGQTWDSNNNPQVTTLPPFFPAATANQASSTWPFLNARCRLQVRQWRTFPVLQQRWSAMVVPPLASGPPNPYKPAPATPYIWAIRILRKCRQPQDGSVPMISPIAWTVWWPGESLFAGSPQVAPNPLPSQPPAGFGSWNDFFLQMAAYQFIESKKLGRLFGSERGRQRNRAS